MTAFQTEPRAWIGNVLAVTAAVAFAVSNTSAGLALHGGSNPITLAAVRFILPAIVLIVWLIAQRRPLSLSKRDGWIAVALGALTAAYSWALLSAIGSIPLALAILIFYLFPLVAMVIIGLFGWEKLGRKTIVAVVVAFCGLALALDPRVGRFDLWGVALALLASLGLGTVIAVSSRVLRGSDTLPVTLYMAATSAVVLISYCAVQGDFLLPNTRSGWFGFVAAALFYAFAMIAFFTAISMVGPTRSSLLGYAEPVVAAGLGVVLLGEVLTLVQIGGILVVVGALAGATLKQSPKRTGALAAPSPIRVKRAHDAE